MIELLPDMPPGVLGFRGTGKVTGEDYENVLMPAVEAHLSEHAGVRLLYHLGEDFQGFDAEALWDDARLGMRHLAAWDRIAVVTSHAWLEKTVQMLGFLIPCPVRVFDGDDLDEAIAWIGARN